MLKQENTLDIAFASSNEVDLDEHFGSCHQLTLYRLSPDSSQFIESIKFNSTPGHNQQKISDRLTALRNCFAVYCLACGNPVRQQLLAQGTRVVIHPHSEAIDNLITKIQCNWPGKIALRESKQRNKKQDDDYFKKLADSEWD
ncbi:hypothetical protein N8878_02525 [Psychromonas sp.]|nr:hypothetical protein [Psychromonas sp.]